MFRKKLHYDKAQCLNMTIIIFRSAAGK